VQWMDEPAGEWSTGSDVSDDDDDLSTVDATQAAFTAQQVRVVTPRLSSTQRIEITHAKRHSMSSICVWLIRVVTTGTFVVGSAQSDGKTRRGAASSGTI
jgi:hypothetical protein